MEPINLLVSTDKIQWGMPLQNLILFAAEFGCSIPYKFLGQSEICRYEKHFKGIALYVTPVFSQDKLISLRAFFEQGEDLEAYRTVRDGVIAEFGQPVHKVNEEIGPNGLSRYPHNIWICPDALIEVGIAEQRAFVPLGNMMVTLKSSYKVVYTDRYLAMVNWRPPRI